MGMTRRQFVGGCAAFGMAANWLAPRWARAAAALPNGALESLWAAVADEESVRIDRLLNRAGYGPRWGDREQVLEMGFEAYLEAQLDYENVADPEVDALLSQLKVYNLPYRDLKYRDEDVVRNEFMMATLMRPLLTTRQVYEAMVEFWNDHFHIYLRGAPSYVVAMKLVEDRDVVRVHALGSFRDLLRGVARSPAMLVYLDNVANKVFEPDDKPNENYARELMELHTVGVDAGYQQSDVQNAARILTGWGIYREGVRAGEFYFNPRAHDYGEKIVMGRTFPAGRGEAEVYEFLDFLASHPATAQFIASKLVRRFVADEPPQDLVDRVAAAYGTDGDIQGMLRTIFLGSEFQGSVGALKLKRPYAYAMSLLRGLNAVVRPWGLDDLVHELRKMGQVPYDWPAPDGYPDTAEEWADNLLPRWDFAMSLALRWVSGIRVPWWRLWSRSGSSDPAGQLDWLAQQLTGGALPQDTLASLVGYVNAGEGWLERWHREQEAAALIACSPTFQWT